MSNPHEAADPDRTGQQVSPVEKHRQSAWVLSAPRARPRRGRPARRPLRVRRRRWRGSRRSTGAGARAGRPTARPSRLRRTTRSRASKSRVAASERGDIEQRHERADVGHWSESEVGSREEQVDGNRKQSDRRADEEAERDRTQPGAADTSDNGAGRFQAATRAVRLRSSPRGRRPTALRPGVASRRTRTVDGTGNWGAGPAFGPTANVKRAADGVAVDGDRPPVDEGTSPRQAASAGTSRVFASFGDRRGGPVVSCLPAASVTETIAKRGSTASS